MVCPAPAGLPCLSLSTASDLLNQKKKLKGVEDRNSSCRSLVAPIYSHACGSRFRARASPDDDGDVLAAALAARSRLRLWLSITMRGRHHAPLELVRRRRLGSLDLAGFSSSRGGPPATPARGRSWARQSNVYCTSGGLRFPARLRLLRRLTDLTLHSKVSELRRRGRRRVRTFLIWVSVSRDLRVSS